MKDTAIIRNLIVLFFAIGSMLQSWDVQSQSNLRALPPSLRDISDEVGALSESEGRALAGKIADVQRESGVRIIIVMAETTAPERIEDYTERLSAHWFEHRPPLYGEERVFVVVDMTDRAVRIVVGESVASLIDQVSKSRFMADIAPMFSRREYFRALAIIIERLASLVIKQRSTIPVSFQAALADPLTCEANSLLMTSAGAGLPTR